jgi:hypothetical protein
MVDDKVKTVLIVNLFASHPRTELKSMLKAPIGNGSSEQWQRHVQATEVAPQNSFSAIPGNHRFAQKPY